MFEQIAGVEELTTNDRGKKARGRGQGPARVTIQDVAAAAGVSNSSVSNYMNNRFERLGAEARERISDAIATLGFRPNQAARQLKTGKIEALALVVPSVVNPFNSQLVFAVEQAAVKAGYTVHLCNTMRDPVVEKRFLENLVGIGVSDLIVMAPLNTRRGPYHVAGDSLSVVAIDANRRDMRLDQVTTVNIDHEEAVELAVEHLYGLGHRRIAFVTDSLITHSRVMRLAGFKAAMLSRDLSAPVIILARDGRSLDIADADMASLGDLIVSDLMELDPHPTAVVAFNDMIAIGFMASLRAMGLSVPADLSLVGIDDVWVSQISYPPLTTVRQPLAAMAEAAVNRITSRVESDSSIDLVFHTELIVRNTCAPPRKRERLLPG